MKNMTWGELEQHPEAGSTPLVESSPTESMNTVISPDQYLAKFAKIQEQRTEITKKKNSDYTADSGDAYANFKLVETLGICSVETGILVRMTDKIARLAGLAKGKECKVADEKYTDTLDDLANYATILQIYLDSKST